MKKSVCFLSAFFALSGISEVSAQSVAHYFIQMPASLTPTVTTETKKDLVDFYNNGKSAAMPSTLGGEVVIKELSDDYMLFQTSDKADMQLKLLRVNDTLRILAVVHTVAAPLKDSRISFYSLLWKPVTGIDFPQFTFLDFLDMEKGKALGLADRFREVSLRNFVSYKFKQNSPRMVVRSSVREDIRPEILKDFEPVMKDSLIFVWDNARFNLQNSDK